MTLKFASWHRIKKLQIHFRTPERPTALIWPINSLLPFRTFDLFFVFLISLSPNPNHNSTQLKSTRLKGGGGPTFCRFYTFFDFFSTIYNLNLNKIYIYKEILKSTIYNLQFRQNALKFLNNQKFQISRHRKGHSPCFTHTWGFVTNTHQQTF